MRLNKIKLAGFKSFVDPTTINFPGDLTAIIGPNGCGKSNVIDAVRWVMGESSAKQLRGDSMDDVIFNGSSSRPAVSNASVELIFDNSEKSLGGQYANYNDIQIRRVVTREGQSQYFLNGTKCRRRDIADIFLGTGLGPRSYAIIEQGMISRIIDAKPEELRIYLEEAAGISKYKERRRETENRIRHTRENLERLNDLREEIEKQLNRLKRQANAAERYKVLKNQERQIKAELLALKWQDLDSSAKQKEGVLSNLQTQIESVISEQRAVEAIIEKSRQEQLAANDNLNKVQGEYYQVGSEISKVEQSIQHHKETMERHSQELRQINEAWQAATQHIEDDKAKLDSLQRSMQDQEPDFNVLKETQAQSLSSLTHAEERMLEWQDEWEQFNHKLAENLRTIEVEASRINQLLEQLERVKLRINRLSEEQEKLTVESSDSQLETLIQTEAKCTRQVEEVEDELTTTQNTILQLRSQIDEQTSDYDGLRESHISIKAELTSLQALQQAALGKQNEETAKWLDRKGFSDFPRLAEEINVEAGWEVAVETVLNNSLEAICIDDINQLTSAFEDFTKGELMFLDSSKLHSLNGDSQDGRVRLSDKITFNGRGQKESLTLINGVYLAEDLPSAVTMRQSLLSHESVITKDGVWIGASWLRINRSLQGEDGIILREQQINNSEQALKRNEVRLTELESQLSNSKRSLVAREEKRESLQQQLQSMLNEHADAKANLNSHRNQLDQVRARKENLSHEMNELDSQIKRDQELLSHAQKNKANAEQQKIQFDSEREQLSRSREHLSSLLAEAKERAESDKQAVHDIMISLESMRTAKASTDQSLHRMQQQIEHLRQRKEELQKALNKDDDPVAGMQDQLQVLLEKRIEIEKVLTEARTRAEIIEKDIREYEGKRADFEHKVQEARSELEDGRLAAKEIRVRCQTIHEQLEEMGHAANDLINGLPEEAKLDDWAANLESLTAKIERMGAINLAAIDEHKEQSERKEYLDLQHKDLTDALETLESAIAKIDKETRARFKDVFEQVNSRLMEMFPRLFGGGEAFLEMIGNDLLSTGIAIMARPPGKRISNIHLMSGGEKALTAVAMVFAIFELNPAPFCMLDEVDAPLDEANVGRFSDLVREMSKNVQFILITHNKTTMEMVDQLMGVTMREAGVSRLVAVDVDEAVKLATA